MATNIEELEERLEKRRQELAQAESEQYAKDLEARMNLEDEHGTIAAVKVARFRKGLPTRAFVKTPTGAQYKRYVDLVGKAADKKNTKAIRDAQEQLASSCWIYPAEADEQKLMLDTFPGLLTSIALAATALAEGKAEDEGKG